MNCISSPAHAKTARLARLKIGGLLGVLLSLACADGDSAVGPVSGSTPTGPATLEVYPDSTTLRANGEMQFDVKVNSGDEEILATSRHRGKGPGTARVKLSPHSVTVAPGSAQTFSASGGTVQTAVHWTATGGTVSTTGQYIAGSVLGKFRVIASTSDGAADTAVVSITETAPSLARVELSPDNVSLSFGGSTQFTAVGKANDGSTVPITARYAATGGNITGSGIYTAGQAPGTFRVVATDSASGKADTTTVTIQDSGPTPQAVVIAPAAVTLGTGTGQQFTATAKMSDGSIKSLAMAFSATGGAISSSGGYTAGPAAGTFRVIANLQGSTLADTSVVTITAPPPPTSSCARRIDVSTVAALSNATSSAQPGDCIIVAAGTYAVGTSSWTRDGTAAQPITLEGAGSVTVLNLGGSGGIYVRGSYWHVRNLRITNGFHGIQTEGVGYVELDGLEIDNVQQAAINLRYGTHHSVVMNSRIRDTGKGTARYGEGVYIGGYAAPGSSAADNAADDNAVLNTTFGPNVRAEAVDISAGADRATVRGNTIDGTGTIYKYGYMNSLIGVRGSGHQISDNVLSKGTPHGIAVYEGSATLRGNRIALFNVWNYSNPVGIIRSGGTVAIYCDNIVTNIPSGGTAFSVPCK